MLDEILYSKDIDIIKNISKLFTYFENLANQINYIDPSNITTLEKLTRLKQNLEKTEEYFKLYIYYNIIEKQIEEYKKFLNTDIEINIIKIEDIPDNIIPKITEIIPSKTKTLKK